MLSGWWYTYPSEKYEFVSWDDEIPNIWKNKIHVPNHQPAINGFLQGENLHRKTGHHNAAVRNLHRTITGCVVDCQLQLSISYI